MAASHTTVSVRAETLERLREYRRGARSLDDVLNELMDAVPSPEFLEEMERRTREPNVPWEDVERRVFGRSR